MHCIVKTMSQIRGIYPYNNPPHFATYFNHGKEPASDGKYYVRKFPYASNLVWVQPWLQSPLAEDVTFEINDWGETNDPILLTIPAGSQYVPNGKAGNIQIRSNGYAMVRITSGTAAYFTLMYEFHRR